MTVTCTARDMEKGDAVAAEIRAAVPHAKVDCLAIDRLDRRSIGALAQTMAARPEPLDVLVDNAGLLVSEMRQLRDWPQHGGAGAKCDSVHLTARPVRSASATTA